MYVCLCGKAKTNKLGVRRSRRIDVKDDQVGKRDSLAI